MVELANWVPEVAFSPFRGHLIWHCIFVFYINCVLSKDTISMYVKLKAIRLNKLDVRKLWTRTELMTSEFSVNGNGRGIRQKRCVTEENANNKQIRNVIWKKKCIVPALILLFLFANPKFPKNLMFVADSSLTWSPRSFKTNPSNGPFRNFTFELRQVTTCKRQITIVYWKFRWKHS